MTVAAGRALCKVNYAKKQVEDFWYKEKMGHFSITDVGR